MSLGTDPSISQSNSSMQVEVSPSFISVLGATGSVGKSTLDVIARHPDKYSVYALSAHSRVNELFEQCVQFNPEVAVVGTAQGAEQLHAKCRARGLQVRVEFGPDALKRYSISGHGGYGRSSHCRGSRSSYLRLLPLMLANGCYWQIKSR